MSKLRASTLRCALSMLRVTMPASIASPSGIFRRSMIALHAVAREDAHQRIVQAQVEARRTRVALAARAAAQLVVDAARLVALGGDDAQAALRRDELVRPCPFVAQRVRSRPSLAAASSDSSASSASIAFSTLPPSTMSVPRPAMLVAIVIIFGRPACATMSASRGVLLGVEHLVRQLRLGRAGSEMISEFSIEVVPTSTGWPRS